MRTIKDDTKQQKSALVNGYVQSGLLPQFYDKGDFIASDAPYEFLYNMRNNPFKHERTLNMLTDNAVAVGYIGFKKSYESYVQSLRKVMVELDEDRVSEFEGQPLDLRTGGWKCDEHGVYKPGSGWDGDSVACVHPIMPVQRLVNIDSGVEKLALAFRKGGYWRTIVADKKTLASANGIIELANVGIAVNSDNCKTLIKYLHDIENLNYDMIPEKRSISRMGWIDDGSFAPYIDDIVFDAEISYKAFFEAIKQKGRYDTWKTMAREIRQNSPIQVRVILAAAFASVLVQPLGVLPFFVHMWGGTGVGKTVAIMLAASVWADPQKGRYWRTFDSTAVGQEKSAGFLNSLPLIIDELQLIADKKSFDKMIYSLSEGVGRSRGSKTGGLQKLETWGNAILTTGEKPLTSLSSGGGAVNRVVDMECKEAFFENPKKVSNDLRKHYGFAGKDFVEHLMSKGNIEKAHAILDDFYTELLSNDTTEKQAMAAALVLTADALATEWIFQDDHALTPNDIKPFLQDKQDVDVNRKAYQFICETIAMNPARFKADDNNGEVWGYIEGDQIHMVRSAFGGVLQNGGYDAKSLLSWMADEGICETTYDFKNKRRIPTKVEKTNGITVRYVVLRTEEFQNEEFEEL